MANVKCIVLPRIAQSNMGCTVNEAIRNSIGSDSPTHILTAIIQLAISKHTTSHIASICLIILCCRNKGCKSEKFAIDLPAAHRQISRCNRNILVKRCSHIIAVRILELNIQVNLCCTDRFCRNLRRFCSTRCYITRISSKRRICRCPFSEVIRIRHPPRALIANSQIDSMFRPANSQRNICVSNTCTVKPCREQHINEAALICRTHG